MYIPDVIMVGVCIMGFVGTLVYISDLRFELQQAEREVDFWQGLCSFS